MKTTKLLFAAMMSLMVLTTACGKNDKGAEEVPAGTPGISPSCVNCAGFVPGPVAFSGNVTSGSIRIDGLQVTADQNSLAALTETNPKITGTYQGIVSGGTLTATGSTCLVDGTYTVQGFQVGVISPSLSTQAMSPLWVLLTGPTSVKAPLYIKLADSNGDDVGDAGSVAYLWLHCNGAWTSVTLSTN